MTPVFWCANIQCKYTVQIYSANIQCSVQNIETMMYIVHVRTVKYGAAVFRVYCTQTE